MDSSSILTFVLVLILSFLISSLSGHAVPVDPLTSSTSSAAVAVTDPTASGVASDAEEASTDIGRDDAFFDSGPTTETSLFFDPSAGFSDQEVVDSLKDGDYGMENPNLFHGDVLSDFPSSKTAVRVFNLWPLGIVPYSMQLSLYPMRDQIRAAMNEIEQKTCIKFRPRLFSPDYVSMGSGSGCYSVIGRSGGPQILSLGKGCSAHTTIVHELMHAIGFEHMHSHRDRDVFLKIHWENIPQDKWRQFEVVSLLGYKTIVPFDFESVMLYGPKTFGQQGKVSMESKVQGKRVLEMKEKSGLSKGDIDGINRLYLCRRNGAGQLINLSE